MAYSRRVCRLALALLFVLLICASAAAQAGDYKLEDFGAVPNDGKDDAPALRAALDALASGGGGRIVFPAGQTDILTPVRKDFLGSAAPVTLTGLISATRVHVAVGSGQNAIHLLNAQSVLVEKLVINGTPATFTWETQFYDADHVLMFSSCQNVVVRDCDFYGVAAISSIVTAVGGDLLVTDSAFRGSHAASIGLVYADNWRGLTIKRADFIDYGTLNGHYHSKSTAHPPAWIFTGPPSARTGPADERRIAIEDVRLDEGAARGVHIEGGADNVSIKGLGVNVNSASTGVGVWLTGVRRAKVEQSWIGFTLQDRPGFRLVNCDVVELESVKFGDGVSHVWTSGDTTWLAMRDCDIPTSQSYPQGVRNEGGTRVEVVKRTTQNAPAAAGAQTDAFDAEASDGAAESQAAPPPLPGDYRLEDYGAVPDDGKDDAPALQAALDALVSQGGGRVVFPAGQTDLLTPVRRDFLTAASSLTLTSLDSSARVRIGTGGAHIAIFISNAETLLVEKLTFIGTMPAPGGPYTYDADSVLMTSSCLRVTVRDTHFYGLAVGTGVLTAFSSDLHLADASFRGCHAAARGALYSHDWRGLTVERVEFTNQGTLDGEDYTKSLDWTTAWIYSGVPKAMTHANGQRRISIEDVTMESHAVRGLFVADGAEFVSVRGMSSDVSTSADGVGAWLVAVGHARIRESQFGGATQDRPGVKLTHVGVTELEGVTFSDGVSHVWTTGTTNWLVLRYCDIPPDQSYPQGVRNEAGTRVEVVERRPVGSIQFSATTYSATEGAAHAVITATRTGETFEPATFDYASADGTAKAPADFSAVYRATRFAAGETQTTFKIPLADDGFYEGPEIINLALSNPTGGATLGQPAAAVLNLDDNEPLPSITVGDVSPNEGAAASFEVKLSVPSAFQIKVNYATANGTAAGSDYTAASGTLTFAPGETTKTVSVQTADDALDEADETFFVNLSQQTNASIADAQGAGTIKDNDAAPSLTLKGAGATEGDAGTTATTYTVTLSAPSGQTVTVSYATADGTATAGSDYTAASGTLTFAPGETSKTFTVLINGDTVGEANETFSVRLATPTNATLGAAEVVATIIDDEEGAIQLGSATYTAGEGDGTLLVNVSRVNGSAGTVTVAYATSDGTAAAGSDYTAASGTLTFAAGETSKTLSLKILEDAFDESDETFNLTLSNATGGATLGTPRAAQLTVTDNDPTPALSVGDVSLTEGNTGATAATFNVTLSSLSSRNVTVSFTTANGTATAGSDYTAAAGTLTFAPGETSKTVVVQVVGDTVGEANETFFVDLSGASNATISKARGVGTVIDNEVGALQLGAATFSVGEDKGPLTVNVTRVNGSAGTVSVNYATTNVTATAGSDYTAASGTLTFGPGETSKTLTLTILDDAVHEGNETVALSLSAPTGGATLGSPNAATLTIVENEAVPALSVGPASAVEDSANVVITVALTPASSRAVTVNYATSNGTATAGSDYTAASGTLTFAPGETSKTFAVSLLDDAIYEGDETAGVGLSAPTGGATLANPSALLTVRDNEQVPVLNVNASAVNERGGPDATFTVTMSPAAGQPMTVDYSTTDGTAKAGSDFNAATGTLTFAPGETSKTFNVRVIDDNVFEGTETAGVALSRPTGGANLGGAPTATLTVEDDETTPALSVADLRATEGNDGSTLAVFEARLTNATTKQVTVSYSTSDGTAKAGSDYTAASGTLTFSPGETSKSINVTLKGDTLHEADETFNVNLSGPSNATVADAQAVGTVANDDAQPALSVDDVTVTEGDGAASAATFTVRLSAASALEARVNFATSDGTATAGSDYTAASGTLTFAPGETSKTFTVQARADALDEPNETFFVTLTAPTGATLADAQGTGTVADDDPTPTLSIADASVKEGNAGTASASFVVTLSAPSGQTVTVSYAAADGTAKAGSDFNAATGALTFAPGETTKTVNVNVNGDTTDEPDESFAVNLSAAAGATLADAQAQGIINDDDDPGAVPSLSIADVTLTEGDTGTANASFTVTLSAASPQTVSVNYATTNGTATAGSDYTAASGTLTFAPGELSKTVNVSVAGDTLDEPSETFFVNLSAAANATVLDAQGSATIVNDDSPRVQFSQAVFTASEASHFVTVTVTRSGDPSAAFSVDYATSDGTATEQPDYTTVLGTLRFAAGETSKSFDVLLTNDGNQEGAEAFHLTLSNPTAGVALGDFTAATVSVADDDDAPSPTNPIDDSQNFVRQHYHDFLNREPDPGGLAHWTNTIEACGADPQCREVRRIDVSAAFFLSIEFQNTGYFVHRLNRASFARPPRYRDFLRDTQEIGRGVVVGQDGWQQLLDARKRALVAEWVQRPEFRAAFDGLTNDQYVFTLFQNAGVTTTQAEREALVAGLNSGAETRASALAKVVESGPVFNQQYNPAFVLMQYFGYLRRDTDEAGYNHWLAHMDRFNLPGEDMTNEGQAHNRVRRSELIKAFITSDEYRGRFRR